MKSITRKCDPSQPAAETAVYLFDDWFDPIEKLGCAIGCANLSRRWAQARRREAAPHCRHGVIDEEIFEHRAAEGPADERCHHRVSQGRAPLNQTESAKDSGHYRTT